jgi:putative transposase
MKRMYRYRLHPTKAQAVFLNQQLWEACELYNCTLQERRDAWKTCRVSVNYYDQANQLSRAGREPGYPRFQSARRYDSITFPTYGDGCRLVNARRLRVQ